MQFSEKTERNIAVRRARESGKTYREIAWEFDISLERARQIIERRKDQSRWYDGRWLRARRGYRKRWVSGYFAESYYERYWQGQKLLCCIRQIDILDVFRK